MRAANCAAEVGSGLVGVPRAACSDSFSARAPRNTAGRSEKKVRFGEGEDKGMLGEETCKLHKAREMTVIEDTP